MIPSCLKHLWHHLLKLCSCFGWHSWFHHTILQWNGSIGDDVSCIVCRTHYEGLMSLMWPCDYNIIGLHGDGFKGFFIKVAIDRSPVVDGIDDDILIFVSTLIIQFSPPPTWSLASTFWHFPCINHLSAWHFFPCVNQISAGQKGSGTCDPRWSQCRLIHLFIWALYFDFFLGVE